MSANLGQPRPLRAMNRARESAAALAQQMPSSFLQGIDFYCARNEKSLRLSLSSADQFKRAQMCSQIRALRRIAKLFPSATDLPSDPVNWNDVPRQREAIAAALAAVMTPAGWRETVRETLATILDTAEETAIGMDEGPKQRDEFTFIEELQALITDLDNIESEGVASRALMSRVPYAAGAGRR